MKLEDVSQAQFRSVKPYRTVLKRAYFIPLRLCGSLLASIMVANITDTDVILVPFPEIYYKPLLVSYTRALYIHLQHVISYRIPL